jgi:hypothetical protein
MKRLLHLIPALLLALGALPSLAGCPAVYPELGTRTRTLPAGQALDPPPPEDLHWLKFLSGRIPKRTRDGRPWQENGLASSYAKLFANNKEVLKSHAQDDTFTPTWPESPHGNYRILPTDRIRIELWDAHAINDKPIGVRELGPASELHVSEGKVTVEFEEGIASAAEVVFAFEPAHAVSGLGLWYELRTNDCAITRKLEGSPADRAGLLPGDEVVRLGGKDVKTLTPDDIRSAFNAVPIGGLKLTVRHATGAMADVVLKEGPIYPAFDQFGAVE